MKKSALLAMSLRMIVLLAVVGAVMACIPPHFEPEPEPEPGAGDVPYRLILEPRTVEGLPGLHSVAYGVHDGTLVMMAGRVNGLHGFAPSREAAKAPSFPRDKANDTVYAVDLAAARLVGQATVNDLPKAIADQLRATNTQSTVLGEWLYIVGGYGSTLDDKSLISLNQALAIHLPSFIDRLAAGGPLDLDFAREHLYVGVPENETMNVTGGDLQTLDGKFLLTFGHRFDGLYTPGGGGVRQEYIESVRVFDLEMTDDTDVDGLRQLKITYLGQEPNPGFDQNMGQVIAGKEPQAPGATYNIPQDPDGPYHRRDLPVRTALDPSGQARIAAYGGVFKGGRMEGYVEPIYITPDASRKAGIALEVDTSAAQLMSQYECPAVAVYSASRQAMYTTFYAGISQYYWDEASGTLKHDAVNMMKSPPRDGLPFINTVSTFRVTADGSAQYLHDGELFPPAPLACGEHTAAYLGAETIFAPVAGVATENEVILLDEVTEPTVIGYLFGGIASTGPYPVDGVTCAAAALYEVRLDPGEATETTKLELPPAAAPGGE